MSGEEPSAPYRLGFCSLRSEPEVTQRMLRYTELPLETVRIHRIDDGAVRSVHSLFLLNPTLEGDELRSFLDYLKGGGTALILVSVELGSHSGVAPTLAPLGLRLGRTRARKTLRITYGPAYPAVFQRGTSVRVRLAEKKQFATFSPIAQEEGGEPPVRCEPLITGSRLLGSDCVAMLVQYGAGRVVVTDSAGRPEDRGNFLRELLRSSSTLPEAEECPRDELLERLPLLIEEAFQVYEELPLDVVRHKLGPAANALRDVELLGLIEELIRDDRVSARIRGSTLVRSW